MSKRKYTVVTLLALLFGSCASLAAAGDKPGDNPYGFGAPAPAALVHAWDDIVPPSGDNLPPGSGTVAGGSKVYATRCAACHGTEGQGVPMDRLVGGQGTLGTAKPVKTVGSYWPYATTVFDYIRRAMPFNAPGTLSDTDNYAVTAFLLNRNGIVPTSAVMNAKTLPAVKMPNRDNFILHDPRPDVH